MVKIKVSWLKILRLIIVISAIGLILFVISHAKTFEELILAFVGIGLIYFFFKDTIYHDIKYKVLKKSPKP
jgi:hypothetical protein